MQKSTHGGHPFKVWPFKRVSLRSGSSKLLLHLEDLAMSTTTTDGLEDIVATHSQICDVDGKLGKLTYFGVDIHDLAQFSTFEETAYLLWHGHLPTKTRLAELTRQLQTQRSLPGSILDLMRLFPTSTSPMDVVRTAISALAA